MKYIFGLLLIALSGGLSATSATPGGEIIHQERSVYTEITVTELQGTRCMEFTGKNPDIRHFQGCLSLKYPNAMFFSYSKALMGSLLLRSDPKRVLVIGLGAGVVPNAIQLLRPNAFIEVAEYDPSVVKVAKDYFGWRENELKKSYVVDGRVFVKQAARTGVKYDIVILDAFNGDYIPEHLITKEFFQEVKSILKPGGVFAANTFSLSKLYDFESATYETVFGDFFNLKPEGNRANRVVLAVNGQKPPVNFIQDSARIYAKPFHDIFNINVNEDLLKIMETDKDWPKDSPVLSDDYAPANLLNAGDELTFNLRKLFIYSPDKAVGLILGLVAALFLAVWISGRAKHWLKLRKSSLGGK